MFTTNVYLCRKYRKWIFLYILRQVVSCILTKAIMRERIIQVMEQERMTQAQFAAAIGIQRAAMSHIISGRNNPSLDVMQKILSCFPAVNPDWLLLGKGEMFRDHAASPDSLFEENQVPAKIEIIPDSEPALQANEKSDDKQPSEKQEACAISVSKTVSKIMVFYSDNTYEMFVPEKPDSE